AAHHVPVLRVDPGGHVVRAADRDDRGDVVDVSVGEDDGDGLQTVLADRLRDAVGGLVAGVDDHALLTGGGGDEITVRPPGPGGEPGNEHDRPSLGRYGRRATGCARGQSRPALPIPQRTHIRYGADAGGRLHRTHAYRPAHETHEETTRWSARNSGGVSSPGRSSCASSSGAPKHGARRARATP